MEFFRDGLTVSCPETLLAVQLPCAMCYLYQNDHASRSASLLHSSMASSGLFRLGYTASSRLRHHAADPSARRS